MQCVKHSIEDYYLHGNIVNKIILLIFFMHFFKISFGPHSGTLQSSSLLKSCFLVRFVPIL
jgi:hypothetical protein